MIPGRVQASRAGGRFIWTALDKMITDKMTINLDVFSSFIKDIIVSNMNDTLVS